MRRSSGSQEFLGLVSAVGDPPRRGGGRGGHRKQDAAVGRPQRAGSKSSGFRVPSGAGDRGGESVLLYEG